MDGFVGKSNSQRTGKGSGELPGSLARAETSPTQGTPPQSKVECLQGGAAFRWETAGAGVLILASLGCAAAPLDTMFLPDLQALSARVPAGWPVGYRGCDDSRHYFCSPTGEAFSLPRRCWTITAMPVQLGWCIPLLFEEERLVVPPKNWSSEVDLGSLQWTLRQ